MKKKCSLQLNNEDIEGINWLLRTLVRIRTQGPGHRSYENAGRAAWAFEKLRKLVEAHDAMHDDEFVEFDEFDEAMFSLHMQKPGEA